MSESVRETPQSRFLGKLERDQFDSDAMARGVARRLSVAAAIMTAPGAVIRDLGRRNNLSAYIASLGLAPGRGFIQVDSYRTPEQRQVFLDWVLTAEFHAYPEGWLELFEEAGYMGDYYWTIIE